MILEDKTGQLMVVDLWQSFSTRLPGLGLVLTSSLEDAELLGSRSLDAVPLWVWRKGSLEKVARPQLQLKRGHLGEGTAAQAGQGLAKA